MLINVRSFLLTFVSIITSNLIRSCLRCDEWREFPSYRKTLSHKRLSPTSADLAALCVPPCRKRKYVRVLTHFKAIYFFYVHNNLCSAFLIREKKNEREKKKRNNKSHPMAAATQLQTSSPPFIAARHGIIIYTRAETWLFQITIAFYFWLFVRTMPLYCVVHSFLFSHSRFSHLWFDFSKRKIFRGARARHWCRGVSQVEFSFNVCLKLSLLSYIRTVPLRIDKPKRIVFFLVDVLSPAG